MNINQIAMELYGKFFSDLKPEQKDNVWREYYKRIKAGAGGN